MIRAVRDGRLLVGAATTMVVVFVLAPIAVVVAMSFSTSPGAMFPPRGFTLAAYLKVLVDPSFQDALLTSLAIALFSTTASLVVGVAAALALVRHDLPGARAIENFLLAPIVFPSLIIGLMLLKLFSTAHMYVGFLNMLIAHTLITLPYVVRTVTASLRQVDGSLEEAARTLGGTDWFVFRHVTLHQILPGMQAGAIFAFLTSFDNFVVSMWLTDAATTTLPVLVFRHITVIFSPSVAAEATLMVALGALGVLLLEWSVGLRRSMSH